MTIKPNFDDHIFLVAVNRYIRQWLKYHEIDLNVYREIISTTKSKSKSKG